MSITSRIPRHATARALVAAVFLVGAVAVTPASAAGGSFTGQYHGVYATYRGGCGASQVYYIKFNSMGSGTYIGQSDALGFLTLDARCAENATLTSTAHPTDSVSMSLRFSSPFTWTYRVRSGTGTFAQAAGSGTFRGTFSSHCCPGTFKATFKGTLTY